MKSFKDYVKQAELNEATYTFNSLKGSAEIVPGIFLLTSDGSRTYIRIIMDQDKLHLKDKLIKKLNSSIKLKSSPKDAKTAFDISIKAKLFNGDERGDEINTDWDMDPKAVKAIPLDQVIKAIKSV